MSKYQYGKFDDGSYIIHKDGWVISPEELVRILNNMPVGLRATSTRDKKETSKGGVSLDR